MAPLRRDSRTAVLVAEKRRAGGRGRLAKPPPLNDVPKPGPRMIRKQLGSDELR